MNAAAREFPPSVRGRRPAAVVACAVALLISSIASAQETNVENEAQILLERELGFELPAPYAFVPTHETPLYIHCSEGAGCPHGDAGHWDISGVIGAPRNSEYWGSIPPLYDLLRESGWAALSPREGRPVTEFIRTDDNEPCTRIFTLDPDWLDAQGVTLHLYPCASFE